DIELGNHNWRVGFSVSSGGAVKASEIERLEAEHLQEVRQRMDQYAQEREEAIAQSQLATQPLTTQAIAAEAPARYGVAHSSGGEQKSEYQERPLPSHIRAQITKDVARNLGIVTYLTAPELALMQQLSKPELVLTSNTTFSSPIGSQFNLESGTIEEKASQSALSSASQGLTLNAGPHQMWQRIEKALRHYAQYQIDKPIRSAALIDTCFTPPAHASSA
ncbi:MAG: hypothetical protein AAFU53_17460, partial [Cyanobacteria bacterium J06632_3]